MRNAEIKVDFTKTTGKVKPMHGVNCAPLKGYSNCSMFHYLQEAGIPFCRLHDFGGQFGGTHFVDVENIFTDMNANEDDENSYDFAFTDHIMAELIKNNIEPFYRLGATIENSQHIKAYHIYPPKDNYKWAKICANIIRHYNEGWANGFHYGIRYWEIWNEPDNYEEISENQMWKGTKEQFYEHYKVVSNYLKKEFPHLKIGGYGSCGFYAIEENAQIVSAANSSPRFDYFIEFFHGFLKYITTPGNESPLDFFSWHTYATIEENIKHADYARRELDRYGFTDTESILNEWNPEFNERGQAFHAAKTAGMLLAMHHKPVDQMEFYTGSLSAYGSFFYPKMTPGEYGLTKEYFVFKNFNELYKLKNAVHISVSGENIYALAACDGEKKALMIANASKEACRLSLKTNGTDMCKARILCIDDEKTNEEIVYDNTEEITLSPSAVLFFIM